MDYLTMNTLVWTIQAILALAFTLAGIFKLTQPRDKVIEYGGKWAEDFSAGHIKIIGAVEVLAAIGIIVPRLLHHGHYSTSIAATIIVIMMLGATYTHIRRGEYHLTPVTIVLLVMALFVGYHTCPGMVGGN